MAKKKKKKSLKAKISKGGGFLLHPFPKAWVDFVKKRQYCTCINSPFFVFRTEPALVESLTPRGLPIWFVVHVLPF